MSGPVNVPINNSSFEITDVPGFPDGDGCGTRWYSSPSWILNNGSGVLELATPNPCGIAAPPDGTHVAITQNSTIYQVLATTPAQLQGLPQLGPGYAQDGTYQLSFWVSNYFPVYPGYYNAELSFGTQEICEISGWGSQIFQEITVVGPLMGGFVFAQSLQADGMPGPPQGMNGLKISLSSSGWPVLFDNVSLKFVLQP